MSEHVQFHDQQQAEGEGFEASLFGCCGDPCIGLDLRFFFASFLFFAEPLF